MLNDAFIKHFSNNERSKLCPPKHLSQVLKGCQFNSPSVRVLLSKALDRLACGFSGGWWSGLVVTGSRVWTELEFDWMSNMNNDEVRIQMWPKRLMCPACGFPVTVGFCFPLWTRRPNEGEKLQETNETSCFSCFITPGVFFNFMSKFRWNISFKVLYKPDLGVSPRCVEMFNLFILHVKEETMSHKEVAAALNSFSFPFLVWRKAFGAAFHCSFFLNEPL